MKYKPLDDQIGISKSRSVITGPSLKMDQRGFPHLAWFNQQLNQNEVNYSFWDGYKWAYYDSTCVHISKEEIVSSQSAFILGTNSPIISFATKQNDGNSFLNFVDIIYGDWRVSNRSMNYDIGWVGLISYNRDVFPAYDSSSSSSKDSSSSSSSSLLSSSSSSSYSSESEGNNSSSSSSEGTSSSESVLNSSSSSSSNSSSSYSSSSSSRSSSSSSSSESESSLSSPSSSSSGGSSSSESSGDSSSSSSSVDDAQLFSVVYDNDNQSFKVYSVSPRYVLRLIGEESVIVDDPSSIKISLGGYYIAITFLGSNGLEYGFFDINNEFWVSFSSFSFSDISIYGFIADYDMDVHYFEDVCYISMAWISDSGERCINSGYVSYPSVVERPSNLVSHRIECDSPDIDTTYIENSYSSITVSLNGFFPYIIASGASTKSFVLDVNMQWVETLVDMSGNNTLRPRMMDSLIYESNLEFAFESNGGIYYFEYSTDTSFEISHSDLLILTEAETIHATYEDQVMDSVLISSIGNNRFGDIVREFERPILITTGDLSSSSSSSSQLSDLTSTSGGFTSDGLTSEDLTSDGLTSDGLTSDGLTSDGLTSDGLTSDGLTSDGLTSDGLTSDGLTSDGLTSDGLTSDGLTSDGLTSDGLTSDGLTSDGLTSDGLTSDGLTSDGLTSDGLTSDGFTDGEGDCAACSDETPQTISVVVSDMTVPSGCQCPSACWDTDAFDNPNGPFTLNRLGDGCCDTPDSCEWCYTTPAFATPYYTNNSPPPTCDELLASPTRVWIYRLTKSGTSWGFSINLAWSDCTGSSTKFSGTATGNTTCASPPAISNSIASNPNPDTHFNWGDGGATFST